VRKLPPWGNMMTPAVHPDQNALGGRKRAIGHKGIAKRKFGGEKNPAAPEKRGFGGGEIVSWKGGREKPRKRDQ